MIVKLEDTPLANNRIGRVISPLEGKEVRIGSYVEIIGKNRADQEVYMYGRVKEILQDSNSYKLEQLDKTKLEVWKQYEKLLKLSFTLTNNEINDQLSKIRLALLDILQKELELKGLI